MDGEDFKVASKSYQTDKSQTIRKMWEIIAQRPSEFDMQIIEALKDTIHTGATGNTGSAGDTSDDRGSYGCYGDMIYKIIREALINHKKDSKNINYLITDLSASKSGGDKKDKKDKKEDNKGDHDKRKDKQTPMKKADAIRLEGTIKKLNERLAVMINSLNPDKLTIPSESIMNSQIMEIRAIGFIYLAWFIIKHRSEYIAAGDITCPYSVIVSLQRFIKLLYSGKDGKDGKDARYTGYNAMKPEESIEVSALLIDDLKHLESIAIRDYKFNGVALYEKASQLILGSDYDAYLPRKRREAFAHQKLVSEKILDIATLKSGMMMFYRTNTNSGKTSSIINLAAAVQELRHRYPSVFGDLQIIATCDVQPVLTRWGQLLYHGGIPFGIGSRRHWPENNPTLTQKIKRKAMEEMSADRDCIDANMRFSNSDTCKSIADRVVIVCEPDIALKILSRAPDAGSRFILLHDEPTMYADDIDNPKLEINMNVMKSAPKWAIFSSATLPCNDKSAVFIEHHKRKFPAAVFVDNYSSEIYTCCNVYNFEGEIVVPHKGCATVAKMTRAIEHIKSNPFLGKLYTPTSIKQLYDNAVRIGSKNDAFMKTIPNIMEIFNHVENLYPDNVRKIAIKILEALLLLTDSQIQAICNTSTRINPTRQIQSSSEEESSSEEDESESSSEESSSDDDDESDSVKPPVSVNKKGIDFANLGTTEAHKFPYLNLIASPTPLEILNRGYNSLVVDIKKKIGSLETLQDNYEKRLDAWTDAYDALEKKVKNQDELSRQQSDMQDSRPVMYFPDECQINTRGHIMKYAKSALGQFNKSKFRIPNDLREFNLDGLHITDDNKLELIAGVGCYGNPENINMPDIYLDDVLDLTARKKMETLIADSSICYGTDYPIGGVVITPEFSDTHSLNTVYQLMARAGRGRKSSTAEIYIHNSCADKILETVKCGIDAENKEAENMIKKFTISI